MKKYILGFAALSLLLVATSCNKETIETADSHNSITFQTILGKQTKASEITTALLQTAANNSANGIAVRAYEDNTSTTAWKSWSLYYDNTATPADWTYGTPVLQPNFNLVYYAWHPTAALSLNAASTGQTAAFNSYTVPVVGSQVDLIAASVPATLDAAINLQFNHLLSQVNFSLLEVKDVKITINSITISDVGNTATYTFGSGWGAVTTTGTPTYAYALPAVFPTDADATISTVNLATTANRLMLMPQTLSAAAKFTINFTLQDTELPTNNVLVANETAEAFLKDFTINTWAPGTRYNYLIDFTNYLADRYIKFSVGVNTWSDSSPIVQYVEVAKANKASLDGAIASLSAWNTASVDIFQITVKEALTANVTLDAITGYSAGDKIVIYIGGLATYDIVAPSGWTAVESSAYVTLTKN